MHASVCIHVARECIIVMLLLVTCIDTEFGCSTTAVDAESCHVDVAVCCVDVEGGGIGTRARSWRNLMYDFAQNTTFHGLRYVAEPQGSSMRR